MNQQYFDYAFTVNSGAVVTQTSEHKSKEKLDMERGNFLLHQAFDEDEAGNLNEAKELYTEAVEVFLKIVCPGRIYDNDMDYNNVLNLSSIALKVHVKSIYRSHMPLIFYIF